MKKILKLALASGALEGALPVPMQLSGLYDFFYPKTSKISYDTSKIIITDSANSSLYYKANVDTESPTATPGPPDYLAFDNTNDRLFGFMYPDVQARVTVPDLVDSISGKGFTCTGLCYDAQRGTYWFGNDGRSVTGDGTYRPTVVEISINEETGAMTLVQDLDLSAVITGSLQGVTVDTSDNTLWVASLSDDKIYHFDKSGNQLSGTITLSVGEANGLAYDPVNDQFWICKQNTLKRYNKSGTATVTVSGITDDLDHLCFDSTNGLLYATYGTNGSGPHRVNVYDTTLSRYYRYVYFLNNIVAIEGIVVRGGKLLVVSNEYFHSVGSSLNQLAIFKIRNMGDTPIATSIMWAGVFTTPVTVSESGDIVWNLGEQNGDVGVDVHFLTQTSLRLAANTGSGTSQRSIASITSSSLGSKTVLVFIIDFTNQQLLTYQNGTLINTLSSGLFSTSGFRMIPTIIGNWIASDRDANINLYGFTVHLNNSGTTARQKIEGYWAWEQGLEGLLPSGHPYKTIRP